MTEKEKILENAGETLEYAKQYIQHQQAAFKLDVAERMSRVLSKLVLSAVLLVLAFFIITLLSVSVALFIGEFCGSNAMGFLCVTSFYLLVACFIYVFKKAVIVNPIVKTILKAFFK